MDFQNKQLPREDYSKEFSLYPSTFDSTASKSYYNNTDPHNEQLNTQLLNKYQEEQQLNCQSIFSFYYHDEKCQYQEQHDINNDQEHENPALFVNETPFSLNDQLQKFQLYNDQNIYNSYTNYQQSNQQNQYNYNNQQRHYQQLNNSYPQENHKIFSEDNQNCLGDSEYHGHGYQEESFQMTDYCFSQNMNNHNSSQIYEKQQMKVTPNEQNCSKNLPPTEKRIAKKRQRKRQKNAIQEDSCSETKNLANNTFKFLFEKIKEDYPNFEYPKDQYISITKFNNILKEQTDQLSQMEFHVFQQRMLTIIDTSLIKKVMNNKTFKTTFETIKYLPGIRFMVLNPCKFSSIKQACNQALKSVQ